MSFPPKYPSVVITCCGTANYDTMGALVAVQKIYKDAVTLLPGSKIKNVKNFFIASMSYLLNMVRPDQVNCERTSCLVVVGRKSSEPVEGLEPFLHNKDLQVHWYTHGSVNDPGSFHPQILPTRTMIRPYGAITSVLTEVLREKKIVPSPEEATIMALGIYEGTGLFTRVSTVAKDLDQAGYLLSCGANFSTIVSLVIQDATMGFLHLSNELTDEISVHKINGQEVYIGRAVAAVPVRELPSAVRKVKQMQSLDIFFAIVRMEDTIYVVGITSLPGLDVRELLSLFSGGEFTGDDCVSIKDASPSQVEAELIGHLHRKLRPPKNAKALMASPAITISPKASCEQAAALMTMYNINTLLVVDPDHNTYEGYITRQIAEKSLFHGLGNQPVEAYMNNESAWVSPESGLGEIERKIIDGKQRVVPVISENKILGVVTRTDLLSYLLRYNNARKAQEKIGGTQKSVRRCSIEDMMTQGLSQEFLELLKSFGRTGQDTGVGIYAVGGFVRDLVLGHSGDDLDIVVEGDAISFARYFARKNDCRVHSHEKFNTAVIVFPNGFKVDAASARREYYTNPAALPTVEQSSIKMDLARRDFTINTLAVHLNPEDFGTMIDYFGALEDIREKTIRVIHNLSFVEDPTRIFRAVRFAGRFGFTIGKNTKKLIQNAMGIDVFKNVTGIRIFSEIKQIFCESNPLPAMELMENFQLAKVIHKDLSFIPHVYQHCESIRTVLAWHENLYSSSSGPGGRNPRQWPVWAIYVMGMLYGCSSAMCQEIASRLMMSGREIRLMLEARSRAEEVLGELEKQFPVPDWQVYWKVVGFIPDLLLYMMAITSSEDVQQALKRFYTCHRTVQTALRGRDLVQMKIPPGPVYTKIKNQIINARIQGKITTREQELAFVKYYIRETCMGA